MGDYTTIRSFYKPDAGETGWDTLINAIFDEIDGDINVEGKIKIWPSGGISFANNSGAHVDPGDDEVRFDQSRVTVNNTLYAPGGAQFPGSIDLPTSDLDVSNPPTNAELAAQFGSPEDGYTIIIDDDGQADDVYLVTYKGGKWWIATLAQAV